MMYMRSPWLRQLYGSPGPGLLPASVLTVDPGTRERLDEVTACCHDLDLSLQNTHTLKLDESGLFPDFGPILEFKRHVDPHHLLNPGKISDTALERAQ